MRALCAAALFVGGVVPLFRLTAQEIAVGPHLVFGDYREVSSDLHYRGGGVGAAVGLTWRKFGADISVARLEYTPTDDGTATQTFDATQVDVRLRYYLTGPVSGELGIVNRKAAPDFEAQSMGGVTAGLRAAYLLGPGVRMGLRGALLFGTKFSGGGKASPLGALGLGLSLGVDALRGRVRFTGEYDFERITREANDGSGEVEVPIQQSLGRLGVAVVF